MLSHLVDAADRADIRRLAKLEAQNGDLADRLARAQARLRVEITTRDATIARLSTLAAEVAAPAQAADDDLDTAVPGAGMAVFANSGQLCSAGTRLFVERRIYEEFTARVAAYSKTLRVSNSADPATDVGPLVSPEQLDRVTGYLAIGRQEGARPLSGGERLTEGDMAKGCFVLPTVFADVRDDMRIAQEEIFGPVISAIPFDSIDEVIDRANRTSYGLGSGVWTRDKSKAHHLARNLRAGSVWIDCYQAMDPAVPFGGYKMSGYGRESGKQHVEEYLNVKAVWIRTA